MSQDKAGRWRDQMKKKKKGPPDEAPRQDARWRVACVLECDSGNGGMEARHSRFVRRLRREHKFCKLFAPASTNEQAQCVCVCVCVCLKKKRTIKTNKKSVKAKRNASGLEASPAVALESPPPPKWHPLFYFLWSLGFLSFSPPIHSLGSPGGEENKVKRKHGEALLGRAHTEKYFPSHLFVYLVRALRYTTLPDFEPRDS
ncbi:hypothetical protein LY78DRAFT_106346 [Colletotrichum sublineola]|nr:hypothetical protein LY78DRAFT_106346 [Colletotrichum sublineola]